MIINKPKKWDIIYRVSWLVIDSYIVVSIRNDMDSSILMLNLKSEKWSDTDKLVNLFREWKDNTKEYDKLIEWYRNLYTNFYWPTGIKLDLRYFSKLKDVREQIKQNKIKEIEKIKNKNNELQKQIDANNLTIKKLTKDL